MLRKHYWAVVDRVTAERYWAIRPQNLLSPNQEPEGRWPRCANHAPPQLRQCASIAASETVANSAIQGFIQALDVFVNTPRSDVVR
jgi:hypothetical protein